MIYKVFGEIRSWFEYFLFRLPGRLGNFLRGLYVCNRASDTVDRPNFATGACLTGISNMTFSEGVAFATGCMLHSETGKLSIGSHSKFNHGVILGADFGSIQIGSNVLVGPNVVMRASNHRFDKVADVPIVKQGHEYGEIIIGDDVWIGAHVTILAGSEIGSHCVIGAGAVVNGKIPAYSVAVGVPAKVVRKLNH